eukprot:365222-Chlamydomonas_euryale.AAC.8
MDSARGNSLPSSETAVGPVQRGLILIALLYVRTPRLCASVIPILADMAAPPSSLPSPSASPNLHPPPPPRSPRLPLTSGSCGSAATMSADSASPDSTSSSASRVFGDSATAIEPSQPGPPC